MRPRAIPIAVEGLTKSFGAVRAVDALAFTVEPGAITGFLGPNGAGKTTTLRMLLGLITPDDGHATFGGVPYAALEQPTRHVGAVLDTSGFHPARTGRDHLRVSATVIGSTRERVTEMLELVGLTAAADRRVGGYSLGMRQRLALAAALLGDPPVLVLDEPANGLDPEGISWMRQFLRELASEGRTVLVSSHVLSEVEQLVDQVVIIRGGQLVHQGPLAELSNGHGGVSVRTPEPERLSAALVRVGIQVQRTEAGGAGQLRVIGTDPAAVGRVAHTERIQLQWLASEVPDLEQTFLSLTNASTSRTRPAPGRRSDDATPRPRRVPEADHDAALGAAGSGSHHGAVRQPADRVFRQPRHVDPPPPHLEGQRTLLASAASAAAPLAAVLAAIGLTGEYRHRTATATFLATPNRGRVVVAKLTAYGLVGMAFAIACVTVAVAIAGPWLAADGLRLQLTQPQTLATMAGALLAVTAFALLGVGLGALLRDQVATVVGLLIYLFVVEPILTGIAALEQWSSYLPGPARNALTGTVISTRSFLDAWQGGLVLLAYAVALAVTGIVLTNRRDIT